MSISVSMHIFTIIHDFRGGGAERVSVLLANAFARFGHRSEILCLTEEGPHRTTVSPAVEVRCLRGSRMFAAAPGIARILRASPHAYALSHLTHVNVVTLAAALIAGSKRVFCVEHNDFRRAAADAPSVISGIAFRLAPLLYPRARALLSVSESVRESLLSSMTLGKCRAEVVPNPLDPVQLKALAAVDPGHPWLDGRTETLVACGRLTAQKNYPMMLAAMARLRERRDVRLIVLGEGPLHADLIQRVSQLGLSQAVDFAGFADNPFSYFAKARLFVSTSDYEGLPMTLLEAIYCGADVVTTDSCSGASELTTGTGFGDCVTRGDIDGFATMVERRLASRPTSLEVKRSALASYEVDAVASRYIDILLHDGD